MRWKRGIAGLVLLGIAVAAPTAHATETTWGRLKTLYGPEAPDARVPALDASYARSLEERGFSLVDVVPVRDDEGSLLALSLGRQGEFRLDVIAPNGAVLAWIQDNILEPMTRCGREFVGCWRWCDREYVNEGYEIGGVRFPGPNGIGCRLDCEFDLAVCVLKHRIPMQGP